MANWCSNTVVFEGEPEAIEHIQQLFKSMAEKQQEENCGQLPDFIEDSNGGYFFDIYQDDDVTGVFQYETKWSPNIEVVKAIAEHYNVNFTQDYEELGNCVCGRATFADKLLIDIYLTMMILKNTNISKKPTLTSFKERNMRVSGIFSKSY